MSTNCETLERTDCKKRDDCVYYNTKVQNDKGKNIWACKERSRKRKRSSPKEAKKSPPKKTSPEIKKSPPKKTSPKEVKKSPPKKEKTPEVKVKTEKELYKGIKGEIVPGMTIRFNRTMQLYRGLWEGIVTKKSKTTVDVEVTRWESSRGWLSIDRIASSYYPRNGTARVKYTDITEIVTPQEKRETLIKKFETKKVEEKVKETKKRKVELKEIKKEREIISKRKMKTGDFGKLFEIMPPNMKYKLLVENLNRNDIQDFCQTNKQIAKYCRNTEKLWERLCARDLGIASWKALFGALHKLDLRARRQEISTLKKRIRDIQRNLPPNYDNLQDWQQRNLNEMLEKTDQVNMMESEFQNRKTDTGFDTKPEENQFVSLFLSMPRDIRYKILLENLNNDEIMALCSIKNKKLWNVCINDENMWKALCVHRLGSPDTWHGVYRQFYHTFVKPNGELKTKMIRDVIRWPMPQRGNFVTRFGSGIRGGHGTPYIVTDVVEKYDKEDDQFRVYEVTLVKIDTEYHNIPFIDTRYESAALNLKDRFENKRYIVTKNTDIIKTKLLIRSERGKKKKREDLLKQKERTLQMKKGALEAGLGKDSKLFQDWQSLYNTIQASIKDTWIVKWDFDGHAAYSGGGSWHLKFGELKYYSHYDEYWD